MENMENTEWYSVIFLLKYANSRLLSRQIPIQISFLAE